MNILETVKGELDLNDLEQKLKVTSIVFTCTCVFMISSNQIHSTTDSILIGAFNAASNLTGVLTDTVKVSCLLHRYGALAFWDYASSGLKQSTTHMRNNYYKNMFQLLTLRST